MWTISIEGGPKKANHAAVVVGKTIFSFGGECDEVKKPKSEGPIEVYALNTETYRWSIVNANPSRTELPDVIPVLISNVKQNESKENYNISHIPFQRSGHSVCVYKEKIYLFGGTNRCLHLDSQLYQFDPVFRIWTLVTVHGQPPNRTGHTSVVYDHKMIVFGGFSMAEEKFTNDTFVFCFATSTWSKLETYGSHPSARDYHAGVVIDNKMLIFGGRNESVQLTNLARLSNCSYYCAYLYQLDLQESTWSRLTVSGQSPGPRRSLSAWVHNEKMYIFGGFDVGMNNFLNDLYSFDPSTRVWQRLQKWSSTANGPCPRRRQAAVVFRDKVFIFGGAYDDGSLNPIKVSADLHVFDYSPSLFYFAAKSIIENKLEDDPIMDPVPTDIRRRIKFITRSNKILHDEQPEVGSICKRHAY